MINLQQFITIKIRNIFLAFFLMSIGIETTFGLYFLVQARNRERNQLFSEFRSILKDPIDQGSHIEAYSRVARYIGKDGIKCISLKIDENNQMGQCNFSSSPISITLDGPDFLSSSRVQVDVWIDDSDIWKRQIFLLVTRSIYYLLALIAFSYFLKKSILRIHHEILIVKSRFDHSFGGTSSQNLTISEFQDLSVTLEDLSKKIKESEKQKVVLDVAKKVSHDIRSPVSVLNIISSRVSRSLPEEGALLKNASLQILKIAEDLLATNRRLPKDEDINQNEFLQERSEKSAPIETKKVQEACREVFKLKEIEFESSPQLSFTFTSSQPTERFVRADGPHLKRIISNLLNNSVESMVGRGFVSLNFEEEENFVVIEIRDSGKGMSSELIKRVRQFPITEGKLGGNGLGLHNSIKTVEGWNGQFEIRSEHSMGTTITIRLPIVLQSSVEVIG